MVQRICSVEGCGKTCRVGDRMCRGHSARFYRYGDPLGQPQRLSAAERHWAKVDRREPEYCWEWQAARDKDGYGVARLNGRKSAAHRASWELVNGPIPAGLLVRHTCDNPPCCNPAHLVLGTVIDNTRDRRERGGILRGAANPSFGVPARVRGELHPLSKLTNKQVAEIRSRITGRYGELLELADEFNVSVSLVSKIKAGGRRADADKRADALPKGRSRTAR